MGKYFDTNICISGIIYAIDLEIYKQKFGKIYFSTRNLGKNTSPYCSRIIVVHVYVNVFSKVHPSCHNISTEQK